MSSLANLGFNEIWAVDFEFRADPGERPVPICLVALELLSRRKLTHPRHSRGLIR